jgi:D-alanine-D-alanine ligase
MSGSITSRWPRSRRRCELDARVRDASARLFVALRGASFGRCDLRIGIDGTPYMLEINPNCGIYYPPADAGSADLCLLHDAEGQRGLHARR